MTGQPTIWALILCLGATGCAPAIPLKSHAHVGHAVTAWRDTPNEHGLLRVARDKADTALGAVRSRNYAGVRLAQVVAALRPDVAGAAGPDEYGVLRAFEGAMDHLEFAASTDDASANLVAAIAEISVVAPAVTGRFEQALELASDGSGDPNERIQAVRELLEHGAEGQDLDGNGRRALSTDEAGLRQIEQALEAALNRESNPRYYPVARKWLFSLVRSADGGWEYVNDGEDPESLYNPTGYE